MPAFSILANFVDIPNRSITPSRIELLDGKIASIREVAAGNLPQPAPFLIPGFIDSHVHIESSMLVPSEFARLAVVHGTVATISDPHEIANVCGVDGVQFMINDGQRTPFHFYFGAPSCVPATRFETSGATITADDVFDLLQKKEIKYLTEVMNVPGVISKDPELFQKIHHAIAAGKPIDGHAPGLRQPTARDYFLAGHDSPIITTDHECVTLDEALEKLSLGIHIQIREGSAAKNFLALEPLIRSHPRQVMFCSDDKHPDSLVHGHINSLCARAVMLGHNPFDVLQIACLNPIHHYHLDVGQARVGDPADFILVEDLTQFRVTHTYLRGELVAQHGQSRLASPKPKSPAINHFNRAPITESDLTLPWRGESQIPVIGVIDGQLITENLTYPPTIHQQTLVANPDTDILKIVVVNRYHPSVIAKGFIRNFGLKYGSIASSVAHDSHNIVAVGTDDESLARAINEVIAHHGGIAAAQSSTSTLNDLPQVQSLPLPVAGLMSQNDGFAVAEAYTTLDAYAKALGSTLTSPWMTLSFMALLVIPHLKISDLGVFDSSSFQFLTPTH